jgi:hypothetical protein
MDEDEGLRIETAQSLSQKSRNGPPLTTTSAKGQTLNDLKRPRGSRSTLETNAIDDLKVLYGAHGGKLYYAQRMR